DVLEQVEDVAVRVAPQDGAVFQRKHPLVVVRPARSYQDSHQFPTPLPSPRRRPGPRAIVGPVASTRKANRTLTAFSRTEGPAGSRSLAIPLISTIGDRRTARRLLAPLRRPGVPLPAVQHPLHVAQAHRE